MRYFIGFFAAMMMLAGCAMAQPAPSSAPTPPPASAPVSTSTTQPHDASIDTVLDALDARGKQLTDMVANVKLSEADTALGLSSTRVGKMWLQRRSPTDARIRVSFDKKVTNDKSVDEKIDYVLDGPWLTERNYRKRTNIRRQVLRPGEKLDLFKLGEGPFPLPMGQSREGVYKQFDVKQIPPAKNDPAGTVHLQLTPKSGTKLARKFSSIGIFVDTQQKMPVRIETLDPNESTMQTTELTEISTNVALKDKDFELEKVDTKDWQMIEEPFAD